MNAIPIVSPIAAGVALAHGTLVSERWRCTHPGSGRAAPSRVHLSLEDAATELSRR